MTSARSLLLRFLGAAAAARRQRRAARALSRGLAAAALTLAGGLLLLQFVPEWRGGVLLALAGTAAAGVALPLSILLARATRRATADWLARADPALHGGAADALEFSDRLAAGSLGDGISPALAAAHVEAAAARLTSANPRRAALAETPRVGSRQVAVALTAAALATLLLPGARQVLLLGPPPPPPDHATALLIELTVRAPAYLGLPERSVAGTGDAVVPVGTHLELRVVADRPLAGATLEPEEGTPIALAVAATEARGLLVVTQDVRYRLRLRGLAGGLDPDPPVHVVRALADEAPRVRLRAPSAEVLLDPGDPLTVAFAVTDDHGVAEVALVLERGVPDDLEPPERLPGPAADTARSVRVGLVTLEPPEVSRHGLHQVTAAALELEPGDLAWVRVEARDADTVTGPKWGASRWVGVVVRSGREARESVDESEEELIERLIAVLAEALVSAPLTLTAPEDLNASFQSVNRGLESVLGAFPRALAALGSGPEQDLAAASALDLMRRRLQDVLRTRLLHGARFGEAVDEQRLRSELAGLHDSEVEEFERDVLFFDTWADRRAAFRAIDAREDLLAAAQALEEALGEGHDAASDEARAAATRALDELAEALADVGPALSDLAGAPGADGREASRAERQLEQAARALREALAAGDTERARRLAEEVKALAGELSRRLASLADRSALGDPALAEELSRVRAELSALRRAQADLRDRTNKLREDADERLGQEQRAEVDRLFAELIAMTDQAIAHEKRGEDGVGESAAAARYFDRVEERAVVDRRLLELEQVRAREGALSRAEASEREQLLDQQRDALMEMLLGPTDMEGLMRGAQGAREQLARLRQTLQDRDAGHARRPARGAMDLLGRLAEEIARAEDEDLAARAPPFRSAAAVASDVLTRLDELERQASAALRASLTAEQQEAASGLEQEQGALAGRTQELLARLRELGADAPFLGNEVGQRVAEASGRMGQAAGQLGEKGLPEASESQGDALEQLAEANRALSPSEQKGQRGGSSGRQDGRRGLARDEVDIPDANAYRVPREFREEILEAMRESAAPAGYEESVREYYRRLVE